MYTESIPSLSWSVVNVQVGRLQTLIETNGDTWTTAIHKQAVLEPIDITPAGLLGDEHTCKQVDFDRAICCHSLAHYRFWAAYFRRPFPIGMFGENLTIDGALDEDVCVGDIFQCGTAVVQVTQPRTPCQTQARRVGIHNFVKLIEQTNRRGFLMRVLEPGVMQVGQPLTLLERPYPDAPLLYVNYKFFDREDIEACGWLATLPPLASEWREKAAARLVKV